ncbi:MAG: ABC transporter ATP-binding protein [Bacteroidetes bacterium]|nr:ABC transporter ATP-binding protein [bacterium]NBP63439.1 ABC transporter ATP-binding protein [Bacteroidota bacterium]
MTSQDDKLYSSVDYTLIRRLLVFVKPYRIPLFIVFILTVIAAGMAPLRPYLTKVGIDSYIIKHDEQGLMMMIGVILSVLLLHAGLQYLTSIMLQRIGQKVLFNIRMEVFNHIQSLSLRSYDTTPVGRLVTRVTNDIEALNELFTSGVVTIFSDILLIAFIISFMLATSWQVTLVTIGVLPILIIATVIFRKKVRVVYSETRRLIGKLNAFLNEYITGITTIQLYSQEKSRFDDFDDINTEHRNVQLKTITYYASFFPVVEFTSALALALILWYTSSHIFEGTMSLGMLIAFTQYAEMFFRPIRDLTEKYNTLQSAVAAAERIYDILDTPIPMKDEATAREMSSFTDEITFNNVTFGYVPDKTVLHDISFTVKKGQMIALVGATGSGKSSIVNLLCRFYDPQSGGISIDGKDIRSFTKSSLRSHIALVLQDVFLFSRSVADNISLGNPSISRTAIEQAADALGAGEFIRSLPEGFDTQMIERAGNLSVGQKQLISFCRALAYDPDILILDEATSSIDTETEQLINASLDTLMCNRTSIVIAHRLSTIQKADTIIVLHQGMIREMGTHQELLKEKGYYARLHALQFGGLNSQEQTSPGA